MKTFFKIAILVMGIVSLPAHAVSGPSVNSVQKEVRSTFVALVHKLGADLRTRQGRSIMAAQHSKIFKVDRPVTKATVGIFYKQEHGFDTGGMYATESRGFAVGTFNNSDGKRYVYRLVIEKGSDDKGRITSEVFQVYAHEALPGDGGFSDNFVRLTDSYGQWNNDVYQYHWTNFQQVIHALQDVRKQLREME